MSMVQAQGMALYDVGGLISHEEVYNALNEAGMGRDTPVSDLPEGLKIMIAQDIPRAYELAHYRALTGQRDKEAVIEAALAGSVEQLRGFGINPAKVRDAWAIAESFDPRRAMEERAAWLVFDNAGRQQVAYARMVIDEASPNGYAWQLDGYWFEAGAAPDGTDMWVGEHQGTYWGFDHAADMEKTLRELVPDMFGEAQGVKWSVVEVDADFAERELGIDGGTARKATGPEIRRMAMEAARAREAEPDGPGYVGGREDEIEELQAEVAWLRAESMVTERKLARKDDQIASLVEQLTAHGIEPLWPEAPGRRVAEKTPSEVLAEMRGLRLDGMDVRWEKTGGTVDEAHALWEKSYECEVSEDVRVAIAWVDGADAWGYELEVYGTRMAATCGSAREALDEAKTRCAEAITGESRLPGGDAARARRAAAPTPSRKAPPSLSEDARAASAASRAAVGAAARWPAKGKPQR